MDPRSHSHHHHHQPKQLEPTLSGGVDTTRVLNLFGYVGPVASLMAHALVPRDPQQGGSGGSRARAGAHNGHPLHGHPSGGVDSHAHAGARAYAALGSSLGDSGRLHRRLSGSGGSGSLSSGRHHSHHAHHHHHHHAPSSRTRFVLTHTEDAIDSVLPCAAERIFKRPSRFGNASALHFSYAQVS